MKSMGLPLENPRSRVDAIPPHAFFVVSAIFHYLGPAFAVLLFARLAPAGVAWLRIASAAAVFALWRRPWRFLGALPARQRLVVVGLGVVLAAMNWVFYESFARIPLGVAVTIEFVGPLVVAAVGSRRPRDFLWVGLAAVGITLFGAGPAKVDRCHRKYALLSTPWEAITAHQL